MYKQLTWILVACLAALAITSCTGSCSDSKTGDNASQTSRHAVTNKDYDNIFNTHTDAFVISTIKDLGNKGITLKNDFDGDGTDEQVTARIANQGVLEITGWRGDFHTQLTPTLGGLFADYNGGNETVELGDYFIQLSAHDLDGDGTDELIVTMGDKSLTAYCAIYSVHNAEDSSFKLQGEIEGMTPMNANAFIVDENNHIRTPYGSQGLYEEYIYDRGTVFKGQ